MPLSNLPPKGYVARKDIPEGWTNELVLIGKQAIIGLAAPNGMLTVGATVVGLSDTGVTYVTHLEHGGNQWRFSPWSNVLYIQALKFEAGT